MGGELHSTSLFFSPRVKDTDRLKKCPAVFTIIISRNHSTMLLFFQLFIDHLSVRPQGGFRSSTVERNRGCSYQAEAEGSPVPPNPSTHPWASQAMPLPSPAGRAYPGCSRRRLSAWEGTSGYSPDTRGLVFPAAAGFGG